jgi:hypothetical protein
MATTPEMRKTIEAFWDEVIKGDGKITEYDLIRALHAMGARAVEILDAIVKGTHIARDFTAALASDLAVALPGCGGEVAAHLQTRYGIHPASMLFGTNQESLPGLLAELGLNGLPVRWLNDGPWVSGLETLPREPLILVGLAIWRPATLHGRADARLSLPGIYVDADLDLKDCDLFGFSDSVCMVRLEGQIRGGRIEASMSLTEGATDLSDMQGLVSGHHTHILSDQGTEGELRLPRFAPRKVDFVRPQ